MRSSVKTVFILLAVFIMTFTLAACGGDSSISAPTAEAPKQQEQAPATKEEPSAEQSQEFDPNDRTGWPDSVRIGTGSVGGTYYIYAGGWGNIVEENTGVSATVEVTGGPNHNIQLIENGDLELGMVTMGPAWEAWHGLEDWTGGKEHKKIRVMFPMYQTYFHWWSLANSGITSVQDLEGLKVGMGPSGGTPGTYLPRFLDIVGVEVDPIFAGIGDLTSQMLDGLLPATGFAAGVPFAAAVEAEAQRDLNFFGFDQEDIDKIVAEYPYFSPAVIPAGTYQTQTEDMLSVGVWNMAVAHEDMPDSFVYQIVDNVLNEYDRMVQVHSASVETLPENIAFNTFLWMHPGAIKWFEKQDIKLPDEVYPPEYPKQ